MITKEQGEQAKAAIDAIWQFVDGLIERPEPETIQKVKCETCTNYAKCSGKASLQCYVPKPAHYDGEPYTGMVDEDDIGKLRGQSLVYMERRNVGSNEWFVSESGPSKGKAVYFEGHCVNYPRWILRAVPVNQWKPGMWAYNTAWGAIVKVTQLSDDAKIVYSRTLDDKALISSGQDSYRDLQDSDWVREIAGVKVRAYETSNKDVRLTYRVCDPHNWFDQGRAPVARELCRLAGVPIMPHELSKGEHKKPE